MNPLIEQSPDTLRLLRDYRAVCREFTQKPTLAWHQWQCDYSDDLLADGLPFDSLVQVTSGRVNVYQDGKTLYQWEEDDCFLASDYRLPVTAHSRPALTVEEATTLRFVPQTEVWLTASTTPLWQQLLHLQRQLFQHVIAALVPSEHRPTPGFRRYKDGDVIIREGDPAEYVYTIMDGAADVYVNDIRVGEIRQEEIFGALAVLCNQTRTATVKARGPCNVLMVPPQEFTTLVNTHPHMFINLLRDLAKTITSLNERVVSMEGR